MTWKRDMEREAAALALPNWEWRVDDVVDITSSWEEPGWEYGYGGESYRTPGRFETRVEIRRKDAEQDTFGTYAGAESNYFTDEDAAAFWNDLHAGRGARLIEADESAEPPGPPGDNFALRP